MTPAEKLDLLFHSVLARFFSIPARAPALGAATFAQMRVLWCLDFRGPSGLSSVSRTLGISNPTATGLVDRLVRQGLVLREPSEQDRRRIVLTLTSAGRRLLAEFARGRRERFRKLFRRLGRSDVERAAGALETLSEVIGKWYDGSE